MIVIGIDSGLDGALVAARVARDTDHSEIVYSTITPTVDGKTRRLYRIHEMLSILRSFALADGPSAGERVAFACLERGGTRPKEGAAQSWTSGYGFGLWEMALAAAGIPYETPTPQQWQKESYRGIVGEGKERSVLVCDRTFPEFNLLRTPRCRKPHTGLADAAAIALYAARRAP